MSKRRSWLPFTMVAAIFIAGNPTQGTALDDDQREALSVLAAAYANNRGAFHWIDCRFEVVRSTATTIEAALKGDFLRTDPPRRGRWIVNREYSRYELLCDASVKAGVEEGLKRHTEEARKKTQAGQKFTSIDCQDEYHLDQARGYSLIHSPLVAAANLFTSDDSEGSGIRITPFSMNIMGSDEYSNPVRYIQKALHGDFVARYVGFEKSETGSAIVVCEVATGYRVRMGFDAEKGYILAMQSDRDQSAGSSGRLYVTYLLEAKQCSNGAWFPTRSITIRNPDSPGPLMVERINTLELGTDVPPDMKEFVIDLPAGTQVNRVGHPEWFTATVGEAIALADLPRLHKRCVDHGQKMKEVAEAEKEASHKKPPAAKSGKLVWAIIGNLAVLLLVIYYFVAKRLAVSRQAGAPENNR